MPYNLESAIPISEVMTTDLMVAEEETDLRDAAQFMLDEKHGYLPVLQKVKLPELSSINIPCYRGKLTVHEITHNELARRLKVTPKTVNN